MTRERLRLQWDMSLGVLENLGGFLGVDLSGLLAVPRRVVAGDRVLFRLAREAAVQGQDVSSQNQERSQKDTTRVVSEVATRDRSTAEAEPTPRAGGPLPRVLDILGDLCFRPNILTYAFSPDPLPEPGWKTEWLLGALFLRTEKRLYYLDFTSPRVRLFFSKTFDFEHEPWESHTKRVQGVAQALGQALKLYRHYSGERGLEWAKVVVPEEGRPIVTTRTEAGQVRTMEVSV